MKKIKKMQRGREVMVYEWALEAAEYILCKTMFCGMVFPETDMTLYWAVALTDTFDEHNKNL